MIRKATSADSGPIAAFLENHIETSMFLLGNLEAHGIGNTTQAHGTAFFLRETGDGITGVFGCTNGGFLMCQLPGLTATEAQTYAHLLKGYTLRGMTGDAAQVQKILDALPVPEDAWHLRRTEPLYRLTLSELDAPQAEIRRPEEADRNVLMDWLPPYAVETGLTAPEHAKAEAQRRAAQIIGSDRFRLLIENGKPVAMAGLNARAGTAVQVGGVYVPPELRKSGRGGRVVAALLADLAQEGATTGLLFAASADAARVYERIGFQRVGDYKVAMLRDLVTLGDPS